MPKSYKANKTRPKSNQPVVQLEGDYFVEEIVDHNFRDGEKYYLIKWQDYSHADNTWEPEAHLHCNSVLEKYLERLENEERLRRERQESEDESSASENTRKQSEQIDPKPSGSRNVSRKSSDSKKRCKPKKRIQYNRFFNDDDTDSESDSAHQSRQVKPSKLSKSSKQSKIASRSTSSKANKTSSSLPRTKSKSASLGEDPDFINSILSHKALSLDFKIPNKNIPTEERSHSRNDSSVSSSTDPELVEGAKCLNFDDSDLESKSKATRRPRNRRELYEEDRFTYETPKPIVHEFFKAEIEDPNDFHQSDCEVDDITTSFNWPKNAEPITIISLMKIQDDQYFIVQFSDNKNYYLKPGICKEKCDDLVNEYKRNRMIENEDILDVLLP